MSIHTDRRSRSHLLSAGVVLALCGTANAQYATGFESPFTPGIITGQDGYYIPVAGSAYGTIQKYVGNLQTIPPNPFGGAQYESSATVDGVNFARAQRNLTWGLGTWTVTWDFCGAYIGTAGAATNNISSFSTQPYTATTANNGWIMLFSYPAIATPTTFQAGINAADAAGVATAQPGYFPSAAWQNLPMNHWFRFSVTTDFGTGRLTSAQVIDLSTCTTTTVDITPANLYCSGGAVAFTTPLTGYRMFGGSSGVAGTIGNVGAYDNINIAAGGHPAPPTCPSVCYADCDHVGGLTGNDFQCFLNAFVANLSYANCDGVGGLTGNDFQCFLNKFVAGCS